jgi:hypothetical protein
MLEIVHTTEGKEPYTAKLKRTHTHIPVERGEVTPGCVKYIVPYSEGDRRVWELLRD